MNSRMWRALGVLGWAAIAVLSLLPAENRPHTGAGGVSEHFLAYALVSACWVLGGLERRALLFVLAAVAVGAGVFELAQIYVPGRTAEWAGLWSAVAGVAAGSLAAALVRRVTASS
jgi:VanZ family protein